MKRRAPPSDTLAATTGTTNLSKNDSTPIASSASGDELEALLRRHSAESAAIAAAAGGGVGADSSVSPSKPSHDDRRNRGTVQSMVNFIDGFARFALIAIAPDFLASLNLEGPGEYIAAADFLMTSPTITGDGAGEGTRSTSTALVHPEHTYQLSTSYATLILAHHSGRYIGRYLVAGGSYLRTKFGGWNGKVWYVRASATLVTLHILTLGFAGRDGLMGRSDTMGIWNSLRFVAGILIGILVEVSNNQSSSNEAEVVPSSQSFLLRSYVAGSMCSIVFSTIMFLILKRHDWANAFVSTVSKGPVQATGCILAIFLIAERALIVCARDSLLATRASARTACIRC